MAALLRDMKDHITTGGGKGVIQDLEWALRTKGGLTPEEEMKLRVVNLLPRMSFVVGAVTGTVVSQFALGIKLRGLPPASPLKKFLTATACGYLNGKFWYHSTLHSCPGALLSMEGGRMKMELANIILNKHSDDAYLIKSVKRHFFAEQLFDDLHQDQPLFRWHPHRSYIDSAFVQRMKEIEATNSDDKARSISEETNATNTPFGDLMEDSLAAR